MIRRISIWVGTLLVLSSMPTLAQETAPAPGRVEITIAPAGGTFFVSKGSNPDFGSYSYGGALTVNLNRFVGVEGEVTGSTGVTQDLELTGGVVNLKTPNSLSYTGNVIVSAAMGHSVVPFVTGGIGGMTMFSRAELGVPDNETFLSTNVGGGIKWYAPSSRWGIRGDYRFIAVPGKDDANPFVGKDTRYAHRVYIGVVINAVR
jgi:Outer membrane protein beta-barrel domain